MQTTSANKRPKPTTKEIELAAKKAKAKACDIKKKS